MPKNWYIWSSRLEAHRKAMILHLIVLHYAIFFWSELYDALFGSRWSLTLCLCDCPSSFFLLSLVLVLVIVNLSLNNVLPNDVGAWLSKSWTYVYRMGNIVIWDVNFNNMVLNPMSMYDYLKDIRWGLVKKQFSFIIVFLLYVIISGHQTPLFSHYNIVMVRNVFLSLHLVSASIN